MTMIKTDVFCGNRMRCARFVNNMVLEDLAEETEIEKKELWCFEVGKKLPTKEQEEIIAKVLKVKPLFFYLVETMPLSEECINFSPRMRRM